MVYLKYLEPTLERIPSEYRSLRQTRHSFATEYLSKGVDPGGIAHTMGHNGPSMVQHRYAKYREKFDGSGLGMSEAVPGDFGISR